MIGQGGLLRGHPARILVALQKLEGGLRLRTSPQMFQRHNLRTQAGGVDV